MAICLYYKQVFGESTILSVLHGYKQKYMEGGREGGSRMRCKIILLLLPIIIQMVCFRIYVFNLHKQPTQVRPLNLSMIHLKVEKEMDI